MMADKFTPKERSRVMSKVRGRGNKSTERRFCAALSAMGARGWRKHPPVYGKPDIAFPDERVAVFLDGCFWHRCPVCQRPMPKSNAEYWERKIGRNVERDTQYTLTLRRQGWSVVRVWEHEIRESPRACVERVMKKVKARAKSGIKACPAKKAGSK